MSIQLHELIVRLQPNTYIKVIRGSEEVVLGNVVSEIDDLKGYHHNYVENMEINLIGTLTIYIE